MENAYKPLSKHGSEYCGQYCYLDGKPAIIRHLQGKLGTVTTLGSNHHQVEFSWAAISHVMERNDNNGEFTS